MTLTFNSLYGIQNTKLMYQQCLLCPFNSLYGIRQCIQDKSKIVQLLSIPFMGFIEFLEKVFEEYGTFNSLYGIPLQPSWMRFLLNTFQFPLWDSNCNRKANKIIIGSFNSLYGILK